MTQHLLRAINLSGKIHMVPALINDDYVIRFCVCAQNANEDDINYAWNVISGTATDVLHACETGNDIDVAEVIEKIASIDMENEEVSSPEVEKFETEENEDDDVFLFDINIPSVPSRSHRMMESNGPSTWTAEERRRNMLLRMISDPKCYSPRILRSLSHKEKRHKSDETQKAQQGANAAIKVKPVQTPS